MSFEQFTQYDVELEVPEEAVQNLDENVRKSMAPLSLVELPPGQRCLELPTNSEFESIIPHGPSFWGRTARVNTTQEDGTSMAYFMKVYLQRSMLEGSMAIA